MSRTSALAQRGILNDYGHFVQARVVRIASHETMMVPETNRGGAEGGGGNGGSGGGSGGGGGNGGGACAQAPSDEHPAGESRKRTVSAHASFG
jgi:hypothetical protein